MICVIEVPTCFTNPNKWTCTDLILKNFPKSFLKTQTFEIGLSDFHNFMFIVLKIHFEKLKNVVYRDYKNVSNERF